MPAPAHAIGVLIYDCARMKGSAQRSPRATSHHAEGVLFTAIGAIGFSGKAVIVKRKAAPRR
jgi:hypothetical protein